MATEKPKGNLNIAYCARHTFKHTLPSPIYDRRIVERALGELWELRYHPNYESHPNSEPSSLKDLIGFDIERSELDDYFGFQKSKRDHLRGMAAIKEYDRIICKTLIIPDVDNSYRKGILTDTIVATKEKLRLEGRVFEYDSEEGEDWRAKMRGYIERQKLRISPDELREMFLDKVSYAMFIVGATFPHLVQGSEAEETVAAWFERKK